jgi:hypothetical protein
MGNIVFLLLLAVSVLNPISSYSYQYKLSICAIFQDEAPYLKEWIDYHRKVGVEYFWLYNNNSADNYKEILAPYIEEGIVVLTEWPSEIKSHEFNHFCYTVQLGAYNHCLDKARGVTKWLALIDTDEFIVPMHTKNIADLLEGKFRYASGLCVNWQLYGTSNVECIQTNESLLEKLTWKARWDYEENKYYKSIVKPYHVKKAIDPHFCEYAKSYYSVNPNFERMGRKGKSNSICIDEIRINHYWTRDLWYLHNVKIPRRQKWGAGPDDILKRASKLNDEYDASILRWMAN